MLPASPRSGLNPEHASYFLFLFEKREKESQSKASGRKQRPVRNLLLFRVNESLVQVNLQVTLRCCASSEGLLPVPGVLHGPSAAEHHHRPGPADRLRRSHLPGNSTPVCQCGAAVVSNVNKV